MRLFTAYPAKGAAMAAARMLAHRWLPGLATAALLAVVAAAPAPAAAAPHFPAAISATHPPGYQIVRAGPFNAPPSGFDSGGSVACPAGTVVWGGGVAFFGGASAGTNVNTSQP